MIQFVPKCGKVTLVGDQSLPLDLDLPTAKRLSVQLGEAISRAEKALTVVDVGITDAADSVWPLKVNTD